MKKKEILPRMMTEFDISCNFFLVKEISMVNIFSGNGVIVSRETILDGLSGVGLEALFVLENVSRETIAALKKKNHRAVFKIFSLLRSPVCVWTQLAPILADCVNNCFT